MLSNKIQLHTGGITIKPFTTEYFSIIIVDGVDVGSFEWNIVEASGFSP